MVIPIKVLWEQSLTDEYIPESMKLGLITPIYKSGCKSEAKNYRSITLTSHVIKTFEKILVDKIVTFMNESDLFNRGQHGFRKGRSCLSQLIQHHISLLEALDEGSECF